MVDTDSECHLMHTAHEGRLSQSYGISEEDLERRAKQWRSLGQPWSLLLDDGQFARSLHRISTSLVLPPRSKGKLRTIPDQRPLLTFLGTQIVVWHRHSLRQVWIIGAR